MKKHLTSFIFFPIQSLIRHKKFGKQIENVKSRIGEGK